MQFDFYAFLQNSENSKEKCLHLDYFWHKAKKQNDKKNDENKIRTSWLETSKTVEDHWKNKKSEFYKIPTGFDFIPVDSANDSNSFDWLPEFSFLLKIPFKLTKPYLSKDDNIFYMLENSLRREKVFKTPMVAASGWKGALRSAMVRQLAKWWATLDEAAKAEPANYERFVSLRIQLTSLFGTERGLDVENKKYEQYLDQIGGEELAREFRQAVQGKISLSGFSSGSLYFYPTFFEAVDIEVITPHDPQTGIPIVGPIYMECVPGGTTGMLTVLYVPSSALVNDENALRKAMAEDLTLLSEGIQAMLTVYGFGAKTSSGFGTADNFLTGDGILEMNTKSTVEKEVEDVKRTTNQNLPKYLESDTRLIEELRSANGDLKTEEDYQQWLQEQKKGYKYNKERKLLYHSAKNWEDRQKQERAAQKSEEKVTPIVPSAREELITVEFKKLEELCIQAIQIAESLMKGRPV